MVFASFPLHLDGFFPAPPGFVCLANGAADSSESDDRGDGDFATIVFAFLAGGTVFPAPSGALPLAYFFPVPPGFGLANRAAAASSVSDNEEGAADARAMGTAAAAATVAGDAIALAAALVEHLRMGLSPTAGSVAAYEGGGLFSHDGHMNSMVAMEVWGVIDRRYEVMCNGLKGKETENLQISSVRLWP